MQKLNLSQKDIERFVKESDAIGEIFRDLIDKLETSNYELEEDETEELKEKYIRLVQIGNVLNFVTVREYKNIDDVRQRVEEVFDMV